MTSPPLRSRPRHRAGPLVAALLGAALLLAPATAAAATSPASGEEPVTDLGVAMQAPNVRLSDVGTLADGTPVAYLFSDGEPVSFNVVDLRTGELLDSHEIPPYAVASAIDVADDGTVYLSVRSPNDGTLWRYEPETGELVEIADGIAGEQMLRMLDIDGDTLYGTTYPNAQVYALDLETEELTVFGSVSESDYAWGLEADGDTVWVGAGTPAQLYRLDPATAEVTPVELPADVVADGGFVQRVETYADLTVFSHRAVGGATLSVHDGTGWLERVPVGGMWLYTEQSVDGAFYYLDSGARLHAYDVASRTSRSVDMSGSGVEGETAGTTRMFLAELGTDDFPGTTVVGTRTDGMVWRYNLRTGAGDVLATEPFGSSVTIMSIAEGGDGQVYVGAYLSPGVMARVDPATGQIEQLDGPEQADSIVALGDRTVIGTYPNAAFYAAEADEAWSWGTNPRHLFTLGRTDTGQDRPRHMAAAGDLVAAGTIPNYGELGGALTLFDPVTGGHEVHRDVVPDQSVTDLAFHEGVVYGGTSVHGGLDSTPTQDTAELFVWDLEEGLVTSGPVVEGAEIVHALTVDATGQVWGMTDTGALFAYDTGTHEVTRTVDTGIRHGNVWGTQSELQLNPRDGLVYGNAGGRLFRFDPAEPELEVLVPSGVQRATVAAGDVYFTDETNVYRYALAAEQHCDVTVTGTHNGPLRLGQGTTCLTDATVRGPVTAGGATALVVTGSRIVGPLNAAGSPRVTVVDSQVTGPVRVDGAGTVTLSGSRVTGPVRITGATGAVVVSGNHITGPLACSGNAHAPVDDGAPNTVVGPASGQCAELG